MDFFFCEMFTQFKHHCFMFYKNRGPKMKSILSAKEIGMYDDALVKIIELGISQGTSRGWDGWEDYRMDAMLHIGKEI